MLIIQFQLCWKLGYEFGKHFRNVRKENSHNVFKYSYFYKKTKFFSLELLEIHKDYETVRLKERDFFQQYRNY